MDPAMFYGVLALSAYLLIGCWLVANITRTDDVVPTWLGWLVIILLWPVVLVKAICRIDGNRIE